MVANVTRSGGLTSKLLKIMSRYGNSAPETLPKIKVNCYRSGCVMLISAKLGLVCGLSTQVFQTVSVKLSEHQDRPTNVSYASKLVN